MLRLLWITLIAAKALKAADDPCTLTHDGIRYDLSPLRNDGGDYVVGDTKKIRLNVCRQIVAETWSLPTDKASTVGIYREGDHSGESLGSFNTTIALSVNPPNHVLSLHYTGGSTCPNRGYDMASILTLTCSHEHSSGPTYVGSPDAGCTHFFVWPTSLACGRSVGSSAWHVIGILILLALVAGVLYLIVGIVYKRSVLGQRGFEQIPTVQSGRFGESLEFVKDMAVISAITVWDTITGLTQRLTNTRGQGFRGLSSDADANARTPFFLDEDDDES